MHQKSRVGTKGRKPSVFCLLAAVPLGLGLLLTAPAASLADQSPGSDPAASQAGGLVLHGPDVGSVEVHHGIAPGSPNGVVTGGPPSSGPTPDIVGCCWSFPHSFSWTASESSDYLTYGMHTYTGTLCFSEKGNKVSGGQNKVDVWLNDDHGSYAITYSSAVFPTDGTWWYACWHKLTSQNRWYFQILSSWDWSHYGSGTVNNS